MRKSGKAAAEQARITEWTRRITEQEMPVFSRTVQQVISVTGDEGSASVDLARVVLHDASMTARVLKLANSSYYNPRNQPISTVSHAVVVLGFNTVLNMCLSIALVESLEKRPAQERLTHELAHAIHAAVQARAIAVARNDDSPEEVFIATLLYRLGDLAFWSCGGDLGRELDTLLRGEELTPAEAEQEVLGFRLQQLTASLIRQWRVNPLLDDMLHRPRRAGDRGRNIVLCHELAEAVEEGWRSPQVKRLTNDLARLAGRNAADISRQLYAKAKEAADIAADYGAAAAARAIPVPIGEPVESDAETEEASEGLAEAPHFPEPDGMFQLSVLREMATLLQGKPDFNLVMKLVMEGMFRGVGLDRVLFALLTPDRRMLRAKFVLGEGHDELMRDFRYTRHPDQPNIFFDCVDRGVEVWADPDKVPRRTAALISSAVTSVLGHAPFFTAPIIVGGKSVGVFVADRSPSGRPLDQEAFEGFKNFVHQAVTGLALLSSRGR